MKRAFTLIELMVVIAVIITLAGLLMPAFRRAHRLAERTKCANNLKQIGIALHLYAADNNGMFPLSNSAKRTGWGTAILPYLDNDQSVFDCPAVSGVGDATTADYWYHSFDGTTYIPETNSQRPIAGCWGSPHDGKENKLRSDGSVFTQ